MRSRSGERQAGLTLLELVVGVGLFGFVLLTALPNFSRTQASGKAVSEMLASALAQARQRAINKGYPVALVLPTGDGAFPQSSSYYLLEGEVPRVSKVVDLRSEHPGVNLFVGAWPTNLAAPTVSPPPGTHFESNFDAARWAMPYPKDYALIFTPDGRLSSNGLPHFDGAYHVAVCEGVVSATTSPAGTPVPVGLTYFTPSEMGRPYTVAVNPLGEVSVQTGLTAATAGVTLRERSPAPPVADPPLLGEALAEAPTILSVTMTPDPSEFGLIAGDDGRVTPDEPVELTVVAEGPGPLTCDWQAPAGDFSQSGPSEMSYDPTTGRWTGTCFWRPPATGAVGAASQLSLNVSGPRVAAAPIPGSSPRLTKGSRTTSGTMVTTAFNTRQVHLLGADGTGRRLVAEATGFAARQPTLSPDGSRFVYYDMTVGSPSYTGNLVICARDGVQLASVPLPAGTCSTGPIFAWNPQGTRLAVPLHRPGLATEDIWMMAADGTNLTRVLSNTSNLATSWPVRWSPDGQRISFRRSTAGAATANADGSDVRALPGTCNGPYSPDGTRVGISNPAGPASTAGFCNVDGSGVTMIPPNNAHLRAWAPDGNSALMMRPVAVGVLEYQWQSLNGAVLGSSIPAQEGLDMSSDGRYLCLRPNTPGSIRIQARDGSGTYDLAAGAGGYYDLP